MAETKRAHNRRHLLGWFDLYIKGRIIDIGCGRIDTHDGIDLIHPGAEAHDKDICDAQTMDAYQNNQFDTVYASHILEHLNDPVTALKNWYRICKPGGHIIISVPHRDLYERQRILPSRWNLDHKTMWLPTHCDPPHTFSLFATVAYALGKFSHEVVYFDIADSCTNHDHPEQHPDGEMSIEMIICKSVE